MGDFLIVSLAEELQAYEDLAQEYQVGFEINDFYDPLVFEDKKRREDIIQKYQKAGIPAGSTITLVDKRKTCIEFLQEFYIGNKQYLQENVTFEFIVADVEKDWKIEKCYDRVEPIICGNL